MSPEVRLFGLDDLVREAVREALLTRASEPAPWLDVKSAAKYLDTTPDAVYSAVKRDDGFPVHRAPNGRLLFRADELDAWVEGSDPRS